MKYYFILWILVFSLFYASNVQAYVGPGIGAGTVAIVLGFIGSVFLALFALIWYPIKRIIRKIRPDKEK